MTVLRVGLITIGQSPRTDVVPDMLAQTGLDIDVLEAGALDGLTLRDVEKLAPQGDEAWLVSRMQDGTEVRIAKRELEPRMQQRIEELETQGVDLIVPLCASDWSSLCPNTSFINPGRALPAIVESVTRPGGVLGVISPTKEQAELAIDRYAERRVPIVSKYAQPYTTPEEIERQCRDAGEQLAQAGVDVIYMGCMGHSASMRAMVREASGIPTLTANSLIASLIRQLMM
jgi:protein AroM